MITDVDANVSAAIISLEIIVSYGSSSCFSYVDLETASSAAIPADADVTAMITSVATTAAYGLF